MSIGTKFEVPEESSFAFLNAALRLEVIPVVFDVSEMCVVLIDPIPE